MKTLDRKMVKVVEFFEDHSITMIQRALWITFFWLLTAAVVSTMSGWIAVLMFVIGFALIAIIALCTAFLWVFEGK